MRNYPEYFGVAQRSLPLNAWGGYSIPGAYPTFTDGAGWDRKPLDDLKLRDERDLLEIIPIVMDLI